MKQGLTSTKTIVRMSPGDFNRELDRMLNSGWELMQEIEYNQGCWIAYVSKIIIPM